MHFLRAFVAAIAVLLAFSLPIGAQTYPDHYDKYINDFADLLTPVQEQEIRVILAPLREERGIEFTVVTLERMSDYGHRGEIEPFATGLFNHWGVGNVDRNDGVMMLVVRSDRQIRIEVGSGYGDTKNAAMQRIIDTAMIPRFRVDDYAGGITQGVQKIAENLTGTATPVQFVPTTTPDERASSPARSPLKVLYFAGGLILASIGAVGTVIYGRRRPYICPNDGTKMYRLRENSDDAHLSIGQQTEERLLSVNYDVFYCTTCRNTIIRGWRNWFTRYRICPNCDFRTLSMTTMITKQAPPGGWGEKRYDYSCGNCNHHYFETHSYREIDDSSSSTSGGSSSFGGGSSSGGGASGRW